MQLHGSFQDLQYGDASITIHMQQAKSLFHELATTGWPISLEDFNLYMFCGLCGEFKDLVTSLATKTESLSYADLHSHLFTHEFLYKTSFQSMDTRSPLLPQPPLLPTSSTHLATSQHNPNFNHNRGRSRGNWHPNSNCHNHQNKFDYRGFYSFTPTNWRQSN